MKKSKRIKLFYTTALLIALLCSQSRTAYAIPTASIYYNETDLNNGWWQYDYTLYNTSDPIADAGFNLYDIFFEFDSNAHLTGFLTPAGWDVVNGSGFAEIFSMNIGAPPTGNDIAPSDSLSGISFQIDYRLGDSFFDTLFENPNDFTNPAFFSEMTVNNTTQSSPIPEPSTVLLLGAGLIAVRIARIRCEVKA